MIKSINLNISSALVSHYNQNTSGFGAIIFNKRNQLTSFNEKMKGPGFINSGIYFFSKEVIVKYKKSGYMSLEYELIPNMIKNNEEIQVITVNKPSFIDIGTEKSIRESTKITKKFL